MPTPSPCHSRRLRVVPWSSRVEAPRGSGRSISRPCLEGSPPFSTRPLIAPGVGRPGLVIWSAAAGRDSLPGAVRDDFGLRAAPTGADVDDRHGRRGEAQSGRCWPRSRGGSREPQLVPGGGCRRLRQHAQVGVPAAAVLAAPETKRGALRGVVRDASFDEAGGVHVGPATEAREIDGRVSMSPCSPRRVCVVSLAPPPSSPPCPLPLFPPPEPFLLTRGCFWKG